MAWLIDNFNLVKPGSFFLGLGLFGLLQARLPHRTLTNILQNWRRNLMLAAVNAAVLGAFCTGCACVWATYLNSSGWGLFNAVALPFWLTQIVGFLVLDLTSYAWHRANHAVPVLWRFHSVHHSDDIFEASTALRFHLGELMISLAVRLVVVGLFGISVSCIMTFELIFQFFNIFEHGNLRLPPAFARRLGYLFVTPAMHLKHHSLERKDLNSNYSTIFSVWDKALGTYHAPQAQEHISVGLPNIHNPQLWSLLVQPFRPWKR